MNIFNKQKPFPGRSLDDLKTSVNILFVDDEEFKLTTELREKDGWKNLRIISKVDSISQKEILDSHLIFVDIQGVGKELGFKNGLDLIVAIKKTYPEKKVVMYSSESKGTVDAFHEADNLVDDRLRKSANRYQFDSCITRLSEECFCLENCAIFIQRVFQRELNLNMDISDIKKNITKLYNKGTVTENDIKKTFKLDNVGSIASIIGLLISLG